VISSSVTWVRDRTETIPVGDLAIGLEERNAIMRTLDSGWLFEGEVMRRFERVRIVRRSEIHRVT